MGVRGEQGGVHYCSMGCNAQSPSGCLFISRNGEIYAGFYSILLSVPDKHNDFEKEGDSNADIHYVLVCDEKRQNEGEHMKKNKFLSVLVTLAVILATLYIPNVPVRSEAEEATTEFSWHTTKIMTNAEAVQRLMDVLNYPTVYVNAAFGHPLKNALARPSLMAKGENESRLEYYEEREEYGYFCFDCSGFIKSVLLWGWEGDSGATYGGASYIYDAVDENGAQYNSQDINQNGFLSLCQKYDDGNENDNKDFTNIQIGEFLYKSGHCGVYIGNGYAIECTVKGKITEDEYSTGVMVTQVENMISDEYPRDSSVETTSWESHWKFPFIYYGDTAADGIKLTLNQHSYSPGEPIDVTIEGINSTQYTYSRVYIYKITGSAYSGKTNLNRWVYAGNGAQSVTPVFPPAAKTTVHINAAAPDASGTLMNLPVGDYMIVLHAGSASSAILAQTTFRVSYPRLCNSSYVTIDRYATENGEDVLLASEGWVSFTICGEILAPDATAWVGVYPQNETFYGYYPSFVWHYVDDYWLTDYHNESVAGYDRQYKYMRLRYDTTNANDLKVVLFLNNGYTPVSEHNIYTINKATDITTVNPLPESDEDPVGVKLFVGDTYVSGSDIFIHFDEVTNKDAWIGLAYIGKPYENTTGMWCYTATGKQWTIAEEDHIVNKGRVMLSANTLDKNSGILTPLPPGKYLIVLYQDGGFVPLAQRQITIISNN